MLDHLVVATTDLDEGERRLADQLGVEPAAHARHAHFGTHNALWALDGRAYLELIAVDPDAPAPDRPRWFGLDTAAVAQRVAERPRLLHWVVGVRAVRPGWTDQHGTALRLSRDHLSWTVTVPADGALPGDGTGTWPTLIAWDGAHPRDGLPDADLHLERLVVSTPRAPALRRRLIAVAPGGGPAARVVVAPGPAGLRAELRTPRGPVVLD